MVSEELINARAILEGSIIRSAQCFSEMINSRVHIEDLSIVFDSAMLNLSNQNHGEGSILLKTEIAGAIGGINYAIYSKEEVKLLCGQVLDGNLEKSQYYEFMIGFLKEVENVLAAAVVTEIANHLDEPIFGDVPKIEAVSVDGIMEVIEKRNDFLVSFSAKHMNHAHKHRTKTKPCEVIGSVNLVAFSQTHK